MIAVVAGTRPEIIKLAPVYAELKRRRLDPVWLYTGQSPDLSTDTFAAFGMKPDVSCELERERGSLTELNALLAQKLDAAYERLSPDVVVMQGDTLSAAVAAQQGFLAKIPTAHVEAGLRSWDIDSPYPEEACRIWIDAVATLKFAPTTSAATTVSGKVYTTGNTVIDAMNMIRPEAKRKGRYAVVTMHRRENLRDVKSVCRAVRRIAKDRVFDYIVWPVHPNPAVRNTVLHEMRGMKNVEVVNPLGYADMVNLMRGAQMLLTDSGGLQEEALGLGVPCLVMRKETERPEGVWAGGARLVGTDPMKIVGWTKWLATNHDEWEAMASAPNPYGDGKASRRIATAVKAFIEGWTPAESKTTWTPPRLATA